MEGSAQYTNPTFESFLKPLIFCASSKKHGFRIGRTYLEFPTGIPVHSLLYLHEQNNTVSSTKSYSCFQYMDDGTFSSNFFFLRKLGCLSTSSMLYNVTNRMLH